MMDLKRSWFSHVDYSPLAAGATVSEEGQGLVAVMEDGIEKVKPSAGSSGEIFAGWAHFRQKDYATAPVVEEIKVPAAAAYEISLGHTNLLAGQIRVRDVVAGTDLDVVTSGSPASGEVRVTAATGLLVFNAAEAGRKMHVYYRYNLTVAQQKAYFYENPTNYPDPNFFTAVGVGKGKGRIYVSSYDQSVDWSAPSLTLRLGAGGIVMSSGSGALIPGGRVVKAPGVGLGQNLLGIEFNA